MRFPDAAKGVKRIFSAEILNLLAKIFLTVAAVIIAVSMLGAAGTAGDAGIANSEDAMAVMGGGILIAGIFALAWLVLALIGFIMNIVGIVNASHDEVSFKSALLFLIIGIFSAGLAGIFYNNPTLSSLLYSLYSLLTLFVYIFVIVGIVKMADQMNRGDVSARGSNVLKLVIVINILALIASLIASIMGGVTASVVASVLFVVALVLNIVQYFMYLSFLSKAKKMLAEK
ncbi:MAG: hypothetical protein IJH40_08485 [Ruminococcus sp.]|uniref:hypothetical protein n=1 Tax=Ruminococcus sp. TaxID=41978 RepID=UPI0028733C86|nr:hypothetical protein [Ruminococcus sp.]MBQ3285662.1 hypothetical protein [Ruminococcus sp.]